MLHWLLYLLMLIVMLAGILITFITLPGLWVTLVAAVIYAICTGFAFISWKTLVALLLLALAGEIVEIGYSGRGAKRAGAGKAGLWGAIIGGVIGGFVISFFLPFGFPLSTIVGICLGTFLGAMIGELLVGKSLGRSALIGLSATTGRVMGTIAKGAIGCVMLMISFWVGLPLHAKAPAKPAIPNTAPATLPAATHPAQ